MRTVKRYGWKPDLPSIHDQYFCNHHRMGAIAVATADLRALCPVIYDQGQLGSCTANAIGGLGQFLMIKLQKPVYRPSRLDIYWWERQMEGTINQDAGASISDGMKVVAIKGVPPEHIDPYNINNFRKAPSTAAVQFAAQHKMGAPFRVNQTLDEIHTVVGGNRLPVVFGFTVYSSFESQTVARTGMVPMPRRGEQILGGHAVMIVGYDDSKKLFTVRNSWGTGWGQQGYCWMPYDYILNRNLASDFWTSTSIA